ncbi:MAG: chloride channel protein [Desulfohalobiaceae bacterium]|nr:chloride channel protein [Desulfohalobiaceae bacterium]MCF8086325.1 chloride channel protein [Desulfohalobiaceae bacterium]
MTRILRRLSSLTRSQIPSLNHTHLRDLSLLGFALAIGILAALGAVAFRSLIELFQYLFWASGDSFLDQVLASPWWMTLALPAAGGLVTGPIIHYLAPEARGPGVPAVILSVSAQQSTIRHRVTFIKGLVSSLLLGTGASVGREGPVVQIGASVGSSLAQLFRLRPDLRRVCLACGAAAGISATFNAPIAGTLFALEIILMNLEVGYISHIVTAAIVGSVLSRAFWGEFPAFEAVPFQLDSYFELAGYLLLGIAAGIVSICFVRLTYGLEGLFGRVPLPGWIKPALGGLGLGCLALALPQVLGVGYETVNAALNNSLLWNTALILLGAKLLATSLCIGSGMSGGILAPSLYLGATLGTAMGILSTQLGVAQGLHPSYFALAGMGAVVSGTTLAPITAIMTIFELTLQYQIILPLMIACISSTLVVRFLFGYSAYEMKLARSGVNIVRGHDVGILRNLYIREFMHRNFAWMSEDAPLKELYQRLMESPFPHFVVLTSSGDLAGVVSLRDLRPVLGRYEELKDTLPVRDIMSREPVSLAERDTMERAMQVFERNHFSFVPVLEDSGSKRVSGILTKDDLLTAYDQRVLKDRVLSCPLTVR